jgi:hypothetical protein
MIFVIIHHCSSNYVRNAFNQFVNMSQFAINFLIFYFFFDKASGLLKDKENLMCIQKLVLSSSLAIMGVAIYADKSDKVINIVDRVIFYLLPLITMLFNLYLLNNMLQAIYKKIMRTKMDEFLMTLQIRRVKKLRFMLVCIAVAYIFELCLPEDSNMHLRYFARFFNDFLSPLFALFLFSTTQICKRQKQQNIF